jgi:spore coat polysaccharide biosynthesis predicted glycosyltransferase SpsG
MSNLHHAKTVLFRVDGGKVYSVAMGHVYRCLRLARALAERGANVSFLMKNYPEGVKMVRSSGWHVDVLDTSISMETEAQITISKAKEMNALLFVDLRTSKESIVALANEQRIFTVVYDDAGLEYPEPAILINPGFDSLTERRYNSTNTRYLLGPEFLILEPQIRECRKDSFSERIGRLFVCFGGADPCNVSLRMIGILLNRDDAFRIDLVLGPAYGHEPDIRNIVNDRDRLGRVTIVVDSNQLSSVHGMADAAITSGGTLVFESVALHVPTFAVPTIEAEAKTVRLLKARDLVGGVDCDVSLMPDEELAAAIDDFIRDPEKRKRQFGNQIKVDFGRGITNIIQEMFH